MLGSTILSFVSREVALSLEVENVLVLWESEYLGPKEASFIERLFLLCPLLRGSTIRGSTVFYWPTVGGIRVYSIQFKINPNPIFYIPQRGGYKDDLGGNSESLLVVVAMVMSHPYYIIITRINIIIKAGMFVWPKFSFFRSETSWNKI